MKHGYLQIPDQTDDAEALLGNAFLHADPAVREALSPGKVPYHDCDRSTLSTFRHGLITTVTLGKCCSVSSDMLPL